MVEFRELSWSPFSDLPLPFLRKLIEYGKEQGDPECNAFVEEVYEKLDWRKCKIPDKLKPYLEQDDSSFLELTQEERDEIAKEYEKNKKKFDFPIEKYRIKK